MPVFFRLPGKLKGKGVDETKIDALRERTPEPVRDRVPPGQFVTNGWPVLHYGSVPRFDPKTWSFKVWGCVANPIELDYLAFRALPQIATTADIHCVTRWSKLGMSWEGVPMRHILDMVQPTASARFVIAHAEAGFTANVPLEAILDEDVLLAHRADGNDISAEHGWPLRLVVPSRYFWKSAKWLRGLEFTTDDRPGFWEQNGYHNDADPWKEERHW